MQSARSAEGEGAAAAWERKQGWKQKMQRNVPAIICKLINFGFGSIWQLWAIFKVKADTHITPPPQSGGKPGCFFIAKYPFSSFFPDQKSPPCKVSSAAAVWFGVFKAL